MHHYLLFHSLAEIASATISFGTFLFAFDRREHPRLTNRGLLQQPSLTGSALRARGAGELFPERVRTVPARHFKS